MNKIVNLSFFIFFTATALLVNGQNRELKLINLSIDSTYDLGTCLKIIHPPYYICCDPDTLNGRDYVQCCDQSPIPKEFRVMCGRCVNEKDFATIPLIMIVEEKQRPFLLEYRVRNYVASHLGKKSRFYSLIRSFRDTLPSRRYIPDSLHQGRIRFVTMKTYKTENRPFRYGKSGNQVWLGNFGISRVYIDEKKGLAMYKMDWIGGGDCGYNNLILLSRQHGQWKFEKRIELGVY